MRNLITKQVVRLMLPVVMAAAAGIFTASCTPDDKATLSVTPSARDIQFSADGLKAFVGEDEITPQFTVATNQKEWKATISETDSWLSAEVSGTVVTLTAAANESTEERGPVKVTIEAGEAQPVVISVKQQGRGSEPVKSVVVAITEEMFDEDYSSSAHYWRDGELTKLADNARTSKITYSGSDIYIAGNKSINNYASAPVYWKNGQQTQLPYGNAESAGVVAIAQSQGDIYIAGEDSNNVILCWKNGEIVSRISSRNYIYMYDMAVSGSDIYVAGFWEDGERDMPTAIYWKNEQQVVLGPIDMSAASAIDVVGNDVYVAGSTIESWETYIMTTGYWKNGNYNMVWRGLNDGQYSEPVAMVVSDGDVYICGYVETASSDTAVYWKNDTMIELAEDASVYDILVDGDDVYVAGSIERSDREIAVYWKNGELFELTTSGDAYATGITLVR